MERCPVSYYSFLHNYIISENFIKFSWYWPIPAWLFFGLHSFQSSETFGFCQRAFTDVLFLFLMDRIILMSSEVGKVNIDGCAFTTFAAYNFKEVWDWHRRARIYRFDLPILSVYSVYFQDLENTWCFSPSLYHVTFDLQRIAPFFRNTIVFSSSTLQLLKKDL